MELIHWSLSPLTTGMTRPSASPWFPRSNSNPDAKVRLFCFAHAGGGASMFARWGMELPSWVEVVGCQLPGREERLREPAIERMEPLLDAIAPELEQRLDLPFAFFGHSLGGWVAFGLARRLQDAGGPLPKRFFASSSRAPHLPSRLPPIHALPDADFIAELQRRYDSFPAVILAEPDLRDMFLRVMRSDFTLFETTTYEAEPPLDCPITAFGGQADSIVTRVDIEPWSLQTAGDFQFRHLPGGHHYLREQPRLFFDALTRALVDLA